MSWLLSAVSRLRLLVRSPASLATVTWVWAHRTWVLLVVAALFAVMALRSCHDLAAQRARADAAEGRAAAEARAAAAGVPVARESGAAALQDAAERLAAENQVLAAELARVRTLLGKTKTELAAHLEAAGRVRGAPRPTQPEGEPPRPPALLLDDTLRLGADLRVERTGEGAHLLVGTLDARRELDGELLLRQAYSAPVTFGQVAPQCAAAAAERAWRAGPVAGATGQSWVAGAAGTYRLELWGYRPELLAGAAGGPGGVAILAGVLF